MVKILAALVAALSILNSSGASPGATKKVAALVVVVTCSGASHSSGNNVTWDHVCIWDKWQPWRLLEVW